MFLPLKTFGERKGHPDQTALAIVRKLLDVGIKRKLAKSCSRQNSFCRNPLNSNSIVSRWISSRLHRLRPETSWLSLIPTSQH
jgi:hypothetical protein